MKNSPKNTFDSQKTKAYAHAVGAYQEMARKHKIPPVPAHFGRCMWEDGCTFAVRRCLNLIDRADDKFDAVSKIMKLFGNEEFTDVEANDNNRA